jgi:hypothetical protein
MLIGLTGHASAGKDTVGALLAATGWQTIAYADGLRLEVADAWGIDGRLLTEPSTKNLAMPQLAAGMARHPNWVRWCMDHGHSLTLARSPRWCLQQWGSMRRADDPLHWVRPVMYWVQYQRQRGQQYLAVTDVRLDNEAAQLRAFNGAIVRVHRPGLATLPTDTATHESERHTLLSADADIHNDADMPHLSAEVWRVVQQLALRFD